MPADGNDVIRTDKLLKNKPCSGRRWPLWINIFIYSSCIYLVDKLLFNQPCKGGGWPVSRKEESCKLVAWYWWLVIGWLVIGMVISCKKMQYWRSPANWLLGYWWMPCGEWLTVMPCDFLQGDAILEESCKLVAWLLGWLLVNALWWLGWWFPCGDLDGDFLQENAILVDKKKSNYWPY